MKQIHIVPLSRQALAIFRELHEKSGGGRFVFPGNWAGNDGPCTGEAVAYPAATRLRHRRTYLSRFRSMASTLVNELGYNADWIERQLALCERNGVRAAYNYAEYSRNGGAWFRTTPTILMVCDWHLTGRSEKTGRQDGRHF